MLIISINFKFLHNNIGFDQNKNFYISQNYYSKTHNKHISLLFFRIYMKNTINMLDDIDNIASYVDAFKWISYSSFR